MCFTSQFWDLTVAGLAIGAVYALIALGYTLVYGVLQLINFAHSEVFMLGAFGGVFALRPLVDETPSGFGSVVFVTVGVLAGGLVGSAAAFVLERTAYRPLRKRNAPRLAYLISAIGASLFMINIAGKEFGRLATNVPKLYTNGTVFTLFGAEVKTEQLVLAGVALLMLLLLDRLVNATRLGQGIRAVAQDAETASLMGVDIDRVIVTTFLIGGFLGGVAGFLFGSITNVQNTMGFIPGVKAFTAAVLGGIGNVRGAMLGGLLLGLVENYGVACTDSAYRDVVAFSILVLVLLVRPSGILGERLGRSA
ncbi:MAG: branched-chain amino acid ABC transporter permease [Mycobacteriales bacterium]|nr:branched-chain amino acid ABC transporter permease [Mycobacteriales bacterium]